MNGRAIFGSLLLLASAAWGQDPPPVYKAAPVEPERLEAFDQRCIAALDIFRFPHPKRQDQPETTRVTDPAVLQLLESDAIYDLRPLLLWRGIPLSDPVKAYFDRQNGWVYYSGPGAELDYLNAWLQPIPSQWDSFSYNIAQSFRLFQERLPAVPAGELPWPSVASLKERKLRFLGGGNLIARSGLRTRLHSSEFRPPGLVEAARDDEFYGVALPQRHTGALEIEVDVQMNPDGLTVSRLALIQLKSAAVPEDETPVEWYYDAPIDFLGGTTFLDEPVMASYPWPHRLLVLNGLEVQELRNPVPPVPPSAQRWLRQGEPPAPPLVSSPTPLESAVVPAFANQLMDWAHGPNGEPFKVDTELTRPLFGNRRVFDLLPFFQRGGAPTYEGCVAWAVPDLGRVFLRYPPESMGLLRDFLAKVPPPESTDWQFVLEVSVHAPGNEQAPLYRLRQLTRQGNWTRQAYGIGRDKVYLPGTATVELVEKHEKARGGKLTSVEAGVSLEINAVLVKNSDQVRIDEEEQPNPSQVEDRGIIELRLEVKLPESAGPGAREFEVMDLKTKELKAGEAFPFTLRPAKVEKDAGEKLEGTVRWKLAGTDLSSERPDAGMWEKRWKEFVPPK